MKIGIVTEYYYPSVGGIQDHVHFYQKALVERGIEAVVVTSQVRDVALPPGEAVPEAGRVIRLGLSRRFPANGSTGRYSAGRGLGAAFQALLEAERFDLVHVHTPFVPMLPMLAMKFARVPVVGTFHTNFAPNADRFIKRFLPFMGEYLRRLDARIAVSDTSAALMRRHFGGAYHVVANGVDVAGFRAGAPVAAYGDDRFNLLFVGRLDPRNGLDDLFAAAEIAAAEVPLRLLVMGDGDRRAHYEREAARRLPGGVVFLGTRLRTRADWYATAGAVCAPMHVASFGLILIEAMAAGRPIIANRIAGFQDVMRHGSEGVFTDTRDPAAFARAIVELARDRRACARLGEAGRQSAERFAWDTLAGDVLDVYREPLGLAAILRRRAS